MAFAASVPSDTQRLEEALAAAGLPLRTPDRSRSAAVCRSRAAGSARRAAACRARLHASRRRPPALAGSCVAAVCRRPRTSGIGSSRACSWSRWPTTARATSSWRGRAPLVGVARSRRGCASAPCRRPPPAATRANVAAGAAGCPSSSGRRRWSVTYARSSRRWRIRPVPDHGAAATGAYRRMGDPRRCASGATTPPGRAGASAAPAGPELRPRRPAGASAHAGRAGASAGAGTGTGTPTRAVARSGRAGASAHAGRAAAASRAVAGPGRAGAAACAGSTIGAAAAPVSASAPASAAVRAARAGSGAARRPTGGRDRLCRARRQRVPTAGRGHSAGAGHGIRVLVRGRNRAPGDDRDAPTRAPVRTARGPADGADLRLRG